jgi:hypothetical protein
MSAEPGRDVEEVTGSQDWEAGSHLQEIMGAFLVKAQAIPAVIPGKFNNVRMIIFGCLASVRA